MRDVLVEQVRRKATYKRGGDRKRVPDELVEGVVIEGPPCDLIDLDAALRRLEVASPRKARIVSLKFFAGLSMAEIAEVLDVPLRTVERDWRFARAWLQTEFGREPWRGGYLIRGCTRGSPRWTRSASSVWRSSSTRSSICRPPSGRPSWRRRAPMRTCGRVFEAMLADDDRGEVGPLEAHVRLAAAAEGGLRPGDRIGPYRIVKTIGSGGMGTAYEVTSLERGEGRPPPTRFAVKVLHPHLSTRTGFEARFRREAEAGQAHRPRERGAHAAGAVIRGRPVLSRHGVRRGADAARAALDDLGRLPEALLREIARQVAAGLAAIHAGGVVHRD